MEELKLYWIYLFANYGPYCVRIRINNKKTPEQLNLKLITPTLLKKLGTDLTVEEIRYLFDKNYYPTATVPNNIEESGNNFYGNEMTSEIYQKIQSDRKVLNGFHYVDQVGIKSTIYSSRIGTPCAEYLQTHVQWLKKALYVAKNSPKHFDKHTVLSLEHLITYYETGREKWFKEHSKEWLQMRNPRVEYQGGFVEEYDDPMATVGTFQFDVTLKSENVGPLLVMLPKFEQAFPFPEEWKRKDMSKIPNASVVRKLMGIGGCGPVFNTIAYCLPNYPDLRSQMGSKQNMYTSPNASNIENYKKYNIFGDLGRLYNKYLPDLKLEDKISNLLVTLHETIGHASGRSEEEKLKTLKNWRHPLEEMRAEILALFTATRFYDEIAQTEILGDWPKKIPKKDMIHLLILEHASSGWRRWGRLPPNTTNLTQAHAIADTGILYYLIDHSNGNVTLREADVNGTPVLYVNIKDASKVLPIIETMARRVQQLSSEAKFEDVDMFMKKYANSTRNPKYAEIVTNIQKIYTGDRLFSLQIFPITELKNNTVHISKPRSVFEACKNIFNLARE